MAQRQGTSGRAEGAPVRVQLTIEEMLAELAAHGGSKYARESGSHHRPDRGVSADQWDL